jgi:hypothetical protein
MIRYARLMALMILLNIGVRFDMSAAEYTTMETISVGRNIGSSLIWQVATSEQKAVKGYLINVNYIDRNDNYIDCRSRGNNQHHPVSLF